MATKYRNSTNHQLTRSWTGRELGDLGKLPVSADPFLPRLKLTNPHLQEGPYIRLAWFKELYFLHANLPPGRLVLPPARRWCFLSLIQISGGQTWLAPATGTVRRNQGLRVVPPGQQPIVLQTYEESTELLVVSAAAQIIPDVDMPLTSTNTRGNLDFEQLAPLLAFAKRAARTRRGEGERMGVLNEVAEKVAQGLFSLILAEGHTGSGPFATAMRTLPLYYKDPTFGGESLATVTGFPLRTLQKSFQDAGTTIGREIRKLRAHEAQNLLRADPSLSTANVASQVGFSSVSTLYRALKEFSVKRQ